MVTCVCVCLGHSFNMYAILNWVQVQLYTDLVQWYVMTEGNQL